MPLGLPPQVFDEYMSFVMKYSDLIEKLPTRCAHACAPVCACVCVYVYACVRIRCLSRCAKHMFLRCTYSHTCTLMHTRTRPHAWPAARAFLTPMDEDEEVEFEIARGVAANIKYKAVGELQPNGEGAGESKLST